MFEKIYVDIHSHIFPGLDDGCKSLSEAIEIAQKMYKLGYRKMIVTPHNQQDWFNNPPEKIIDALNKLNVAFSIHRLNMKLEAASEYYLDNLFLEQIRQKKALTFGKKYVLVELSPFILDKYLFQHLQEIINTGYIPVLAHPERYIYFYQQKDKYHKLHEMGVKLQLNLVALSKSVSNEMRSIAEYLVDEKLVSFCGSDSHSIKNPMILETLEKETLYLEKLIKTNPLLNHTLF
jgi:tyrosine-protein phosphatase YwqE